MAVGGGVVVVMLLLYAMCDLYVLVLLSLCLVYVV